MSSQESTAPFATLRGDVRRTVADLSSMLAARRRLAELEIRHDVAITRRLLMVGGTAVVLLIVGIPVAVVALTLQLEAWFSTSWHFPTLIVGLFLILLGVGVLWSSCSRFRRDFLGFQESMAELREDLVWLRDWAENEESNADGNSRNA